VAAVAALILTAGSVNAYLSGATEMLRELSGGRTGAFLGVIAATGLALIGLSALGLADTTALVSVPTTLFVCVYLSCTAAAVRILGVRLRLAAAVAVLAVLVILAFCGWGLAPAGAIAVVAAVTTRGTAACKAVPAPAAA
jgi:amino acid efflux transporter